jgi:ABC-type branched-subunit amino acid transport system ATPase component
MGIVTVSVERSAAGESPELTISSLTVRFGALTALDGADLAVRAGETVAIAGENGAGKTLEREKALAAHQEAMALRQSREL